MPVLKFLPVFKPSCNYPSKKAIRNEVTHHRGPAGEAELGYNKTPQGVSKDFNYVEQEENHISHRSYPTRLSQLVNSNYHEVNENSEFYDNKYNEKQHERIEKPFNHGRNSINWKTNSQNYVIPEKGSLFSNSNDKSLLKYSNKHYKTYILGPNEINENVIREIIGPKKLVGISQCTKSQYEESEKWSGISKQVSRYDNSKLNEYNGKRNAKSADYVKEKRSRWKLNSDQHYVFRKKSPLEYLHIKNDENNKYYTDLVNGVQEKENPRINNSVNNFSLGYKTQNEWHNKEDNLPVRIIKTAQDSKLDKSSLKLTDSRIQEEIDNLQLNNNKNYLENNIKFSATGSTQTNHMEINNDNKLDLSKNSFNGQNTLPVKDALLKYSTDEKPYINSSKTVNNTQQFTNGLLLKIDSKILDPAIHTIAQQLKAETSDVVHKGVKMDIKTSENSTESTQNYIYLQPIPLGSPYLTQKPNNQNESSINLQQQRASDDIIISINPRTLDNKILHAEFFKKSEEKKTPDTLSIELLPIGNAQGAGNITNTGENKANLTLTSKSPQSVVTEKAVVGEKKGITNTNLPNEIHNIENHLKSNTINIEMTKLGESVKNVQKRKCQRCDHMSGRNNNKFREANVPTVSHKYDIEDNELDQNAIPSNSLDKVIVLQPKQREICQSQLGCEATPKIVHCADSNCYKTTQNIHTFRELNEGRLKEDDTEEFNQIYVENPNWTKECSSISGNPPFKCFNTTNTQKCPSQCLPNEFNRESGQHGLSQTNKQTEDLESIRHNKPERMKRDSSEKKEELIQLKDESEINLEKGSKKVENKILEGFINSIIANYSREGGKATTQEPINNIEKSDDGDALIHIIKDFTNKKKIEGSDNLNLMPLIIPESKASQIKDNEIISKFGPFSEDELKSLLEKFHIN